MKAMILAAGRGERLDPLTRQTPKPMLEVAGKPLIEHQIGWLAAGGIREIVINLHHLGSQIANYLGDGARFGVNIQYSHEPRLLDTGAGIQNALPLLGPDPFVVLNGDIWTDFDFRQIPSGAVPPALAHLILTATPAFRRGDFDLREGRVVRSEYRPLVYCGIALLSRELFRLNTEPVSTASSHRTPSPQPGKEIEPYSLAPLYFAAAAAGRLSGKLFSGNWVDIGTPEQYENLVQQT